MITLNKSTRIDKHNVYGECTAETVADLDNFPDFARANELQHGSAVLCQENGEVYTMRPDYTLKQL
jgi:hypothetical protein